LLEYATTHTQETTHQDIPKPSPEVSKLIMQLYKEPDIEKTLQRAAEIQLQDTTD
jgi:hypothetical protein